MARRRRGGVLNPARLLQIAEHAARTFPDETALVRAGMAVDLLGDEIGPQAPAHEAALALAFVVLASLHHPTAEMIAAPGADAAAWRAMVVAALGCVREAPA